MLEALTPLRVLAGATAAATLAGIPAAFYNRKFGRRAEQGTPPAGSFVEVDGARLHYLRRGSGSIIVLLHGNGVMLQDWTAPGIFDELAKTHDVIAFDRPGFGYSTRSRLEIWSPERQATAIADALIKLSVPDATIVGHSFGTLVAASLALDHPAFVSRLVLLGGYYFPLARVDLLINSFPAIPVLGDIMRYTISPILLRTLIPVIDKILFGPASVSSHWKDDFPVAMLSRPSQLHATSADAALANVAAAALSDRYPSILVPTTIVAGTGDLVVPYREQSERLHAVLPSSQFLALNEMGHMIHYSAPEAVIQAIAPQRAIGVGFTSGGDRVHRASEPDRMRR
jgi:pimeloyl-ACP methyl ester carboxylesterase